MRQLRHISTQLVLMGLFFSAAQAVGSDYFVDKPNVCMASTKPPAKPMPLEFCYWLNDNSCCTPGNDLAAENAFYALVGTGSGCSPSEHIVRATNNEMRDFLCMGCDPNEPTYRYLPYYGDAATPANTSWAPDQFVWRICQSFVFGKDGKSGLWGGDGSKFNRCGVQIPEGGSNVLVFPQAEYGSAAPDQQTAGQIFLSVLPQWLPGFHFVIVNDTAPTFNFTATPCFRGTNAASTTVSTLAFVVALLAVCFS